MVGTSGTRVVAVAADIPVETEHGLEAEEGLEDRLGELQSLWSKASQLLSEGKVVKAPGSNPKIRWVSSESSVSPHVVTTSK